MRKRTHLLILLLAISLGTMAETVVLKTGARIHGTILFANDEALVVQNDKGARFQYLRTDIANILEDSDEEALEVEETAVETPKRVTIGIEVGGGVALQPATAYNGVASVDLVVGTHNLLQRHIVLGGSFGYRGVIRAGATRTYLPLQLVMRAPLMEQKHAPVVGVHAGYCFAADKLEKGGIIAGANLGYRCALNDRLALMLLGDVTWQQTDALSQTVIIEDNTFQSNRPASLVNISLKLGLYF